MDVIAIDWSGRISGERKTIWTAHVRDGQLISLDNGRRRAEVIDHVISVASTIERLVVGLDFAFSFPAWFLADHGMESVDDLWRVVEAEGERWLAECLPPFWGKPGCRRPVIDNPYRETEREFPAVAGVQAKSVFQVGGAGAVGTGSIRGMPFLRRLREAGFSIWPFHEAGWPRVVEIYPRLLTGPVVKSSQGGRERYLEDRFPNLGFDMAKIGASSEDAFDAAVSALVMGERAEELENLAQETEVPGRLEGRIWCPTMPPSSVEVHSKPEAVAEIDVLRMWTDWIDRLKDHLVGICGHRTMWTEVRQAVYDRASETPDAWLKHYTRLYVDGQVIAMRRLLRAKGPDTITLGKLLESIEKNPGLLSRDAFLSRWMNGRENDPDAPAWRRNGEKAYEAWDNGNGRLNVQMVRDDKKAVNAAAQGVIDLADLSIAHITDSDLPTVTFTDLDSAIDLTGAVFNTYAGLVTFSHYELGPVVQENWRTTFDRPLFDPPPEYPWTDLD